MNVEDVVLAAGRIQDTLRALYQYNHHNTNSDIARGPLSKVMIREERTRSLIDRRNVIIVVVIVVASFTNHGSL